MGVHNKQRRAAKQRRRAKRRTGTGPQPRPGAGPDPFETAYADPFTTAYDGRAQASALVREVIVGISAGRESVPEWAEALTGPGLAVPLGFVGDALAETLTATVTDCVRDGWTPYDLSQIVRRRQTAGHVPYLAHLLAAEADRHPADAVDPEWLRDLEGIGAPVPADLATTGGVATALGLAGLLGALPPLARTIPPPGSARRANTSGTSHAAGRQLARVRALLAKAESTDYDEEAEALSAKAQELVSRHALERLLEQADESGDAGTADGRGVVTRRLWIDAPYVVAKAALVEKVAHANRCRAAASTELGFSSVVGDPGDLEAVEVLVTSLLVQANAAMVRHGRQVDVSGRSRTRSFRQSFLVSYATRVGERLRAASDRAAAGVGQHSALPVLRAQEERVHAEWERIFPHVVMRSTGVSNGRGWEAGRAAADLARLDIGPAVAEGGADDTAQTRNAS